MQLFRTNRLLLILIAGLSLIAVLVFIGSIGSPDSSDVGTLREFTVLGQAIPMWSATPVPIPTERPPQPPATLDLYLDVSYPMGGFVPLVTGGDDFSAFRSIAQLASDHLVRSYGRSTISVTWRGVGESLAVLGTSPRVDRALFTGRSTRLDLAIRDALANLRSGRAEAAVLVTDLMTTGDTTGPLGVARELSPWLESPSVRSGQFHAGLLGVRADYWGVTDGRSCPERGGLGCWFSERSPGYRRLDKVVRLPFYVLVIGRGRDEIDGIGRALLEDIGKLAANRKMEIETRWELLTEESQRRSSVLSCRTFRADNSAVQYALRREASGAYSCVRNEPVAMSCGLGDLRPQSVKIAGNPSSKIFNAVIKGDRIEVLVGCDAVIADGTRPELKLELEAAASGTQDNWDSWSTETDELVESLGRTLQLKYFLQEARVKPDSYRVDLPAVLGATP